MILYVDTSCLLKCYIAEPHCGEAREWVAAADAVATSRVTYPEMAAAFGQRQRRGDVSAALVHRSLRHLSHRWTELLLVDITEIRAAGLALRHALRGFDAVQLAGALALRAAVGGDDIAFASFDEQLNRAARGEGLIVLEPSRP